MKNPAPVLKTAVARFRAEYRKSAIVSTGIFLILVIAAFMLVGRFLSSRHRGTAAEAALLEKKLVYRTDLIRHKARIEQDLVSLGNNWRVMRPRLFSETNDDMASAHIQRILDELTAASSVSIKSYKIEAVQKAGDYSILPVSLDLVVNYEDLVAILYQIEKHSYYLKISDLEFRSTGGDADILVRLVVEGYRYHEKANS